MIKIKQRWAMDLVQNDSQYEVILSSLSILQLCKKSKITK